MVSLRWFGICAFTLALVSHPQVGLAKGSKSKAKERFVRKTIRDICLHPDPATLVAVEGHIVRRTGYHRYILVDKTGRIHLELADSVVKERGFTDADLLRISGEVEFIAEKRPEINVQSVKLISNNS